MKKSKLWILSVFSIPMTALFGYSTYSLYYEFLAWDGIEIPLPEGKKAIVIMFSEK